MENHLGQHSALFAVKVKRNNPGWQGAFVAQAGNAEIAGGKSSAQDAQARQKLRHFPRSMRIALAAGRFDAASQRRAGFVRPTELCELLAGHEKCRYVGLGPRHQRLKAYQAALVILFLLELQGQAVPQELIAWFIGQHGFYLFAPSWHKNTVT
jgi:hypothetical protein